MNWCGLRDGRLRGARNDSGTTAQNDRNDNCTTAQNDWNGSFTAASPQLGNRMKNLVKMEVIIVRRTLTVTALLMGLLLCVSLAACGSSGQAGEETAATEATTAAEDENQTVGMPNPWRTAESAEDAARGAGLDSFGSPEGSSISLGEIKDVKYRCMEGIADADFTIGAVRITIRKGLASAAVEEGDISGDYNEYKYNWPRTINGLDVSCFGNREGEAAKTIWTVDDYDFAILVREDSDEDDYSLDENDYGLSEDDLSVLINGIQ